jgi:hypothetical protein
MARVPWLANKKRTCILSQVDQGRKRVLWIMAAILTAMHMRTAGDLFGTPSGTPQSDRLIEASIQAGVD